MKHSVIVDFKGPMDGKVPNPGEQVHFVRSVLNLKTKDVTEMQLHGVTQHLIISLVDENVHHAVLQKLEKGVTWDKYPGLKFYGWSTSEELTSVNVINWNKYLPWKELLLELERHGRIVSHRVGYWREEPTWPNGKLYFRMKLRDGARLPAFIEFPDFNQVVQVFTESSERVCFRCTKKGHIAAFCRNKAKDVDYVNSPTQSWAQVVKQGTSATNSNGSSHAPGQAPNAAGQQGGATGGRSMSAPSSPARQSSSKDDRAGAKGTGEKASDAGEDGVVGQGQQSLVSPPEGAAKAAENASDVSMFTDKSEVVAPSNNSVKLIPDTQGDDMTEGSDDDEHGSSYDLPCGQGHLEHSTDVSELPCGQRDKFSVHSDPESWSLATNKRGRRDHKTLSASSSESDSVVGVSTDTNKKAKVHRTEKEKHKEKYLAKVLRKKSAKGGTPAVKHKN